MKLVLLICSFAFLSLCFAVLSQFPDQKLHVYICDVGQGDGMLIQKGSMQMIVDAGPDNSIQTCLGNHMPFWDRTIEIALMTHADSDHYFGFTEIAKRYSIQTFMGSTIDNEGPEYRALKEILLEKQIPVVGLKAGQLVREGMFSFKIIYPTEGLISQNSTPSESAQVLGSRIQDSRNDYCAVGHLTFGNFSGLFTCDLSPRAGETMIALGVVPHTYFLKVSHHGSKNGLTQDFLDHVNPSIASISVGTKNRYGHPSASVIEMLEKKEVKTYRTDIHGEIEIVTDGETVQVHTQKQ